MACFARDYRLSVTGLALVVLIACGHNGGGGALGADANRDGASANQDGDTGHDANGVDTNGGPDGNAGNDASPGVDGNTTPDAGSSTPCGLPVCARAFSSGSDGAALAVAVDSANNVYVAGMSESDLAFGSNTLFKLGARDAFVVSFAADGSYRWAKRWGHSTKLVGAYGIAVDASNNIYIVGGMTGAIDFGGGFVGTSPGMFVASFDHNGSYRWARGDGGNSGLLDVAVADGKVYGIGRFLGSVTFSPTTTLTSAGAEDVVVAAFETANGAFAWARRIGTSATDTEGALVARAGSIAFSMSSGAIGTGERLVSWTSAGADRWNIAVPAALDLRGLSVDAAGTLYLSGRHRGGTDTVPGAPIVNGDNEYVHAYADGGTSLWSWTLPESPAHMTTAIPLTPSAFDPTGRLVLAGTYDGTLYTGSTTLTNGGKTIFLATFTTTGTPVAARRFDDASTTANEWVHGVAIDSVGTTYVVGMYFGAPNFGDGVLPFASQGGVLILRIAP